MSLEGGAVIIVAPVLLLGVPLIGLAAAGVAVGATAVVAVQGARLAYHGAVAGSKIAAQGAQVGAELAVAGGQAVIAGSQALADATQRAIETEKRRQVDAYAARFAERDAARDRAIAALGAQWRAQVASPVRTPRIAALRDHRAAQAPSAPDPAIARAERLLASLQGSGPADPGPGQRFAELLAAAAQFIQDHDASKLVAPVREELAALADLAATDPAAAIGRTGVLSQLLAAVRAQLDAARADVTPRLAEVGARVMLLRQGADQLAAAHGDAATARAELAVWEQRAATLEQLADTAPDLARGEAMAMLRELEALFAQGRDAIVNGQRETVLASLRRSLSALGYQIVSESDQGEDRRLAATHLADQRRITFFVSPDGQLRFDVLDGYHGEACLEVLETIFAQMERDGVRFGGPPTFDTLDETLRNVGLSFLAERFEFLAYDAAETSPEPDAPQVSRRRERT